jgi:hypothetical protein
MMIRKNKVTQPGAGLGRRKFPQFMKSFLLNPAEQTFTKTTWAEGALSDIMKAAVF